MGLSRLPGLGSGPWGVVGRGFGVSGASWVVVGIDFGGNPCLLELQAVLYISDLGLAFCGLVQPVCF